MWGYKVKLDKCDILFSKIIRLRDGECLKCHRKGEPDKEGLPIIGLQCSHYFSRRNESTRFDEDNCMSLCAYHHDYLGHGDGKDEYKLMMIKKLGEREFKLLQIKANTFKKKDRKMTYIILKKIYEDFKRKEKIKI